MSLKELFKREYLRELDSFAPESYAALEGKLGGFSREEIETIFEAKKTARSRAEKLFEYVKTDAGLLADAWVAEVEKRRPRRFLAKMFDAPKESVRELAEALEN